MTATTTPSIKCRQCGVEIDHRPPVVGALVFCSKQCAYVWCVPDPSVIV